MHERSIEAHSEAEEPSSLDATLGEPLGAARLLHLAEIAEKLNAISVTEEARELATRVSEGRFYVACVGQFKRGKSTLINALIGQPILPTGFVPVTAVPTVVRYGEKASARIRTGDGDSRDGKWKDISVSDLKNYVTEELNPENRLNVQGAEVFVPSPLLSTGMCFVDTPGLGSVFAGNTATTHAFIPHIDAALIVIGADPPLAGEELMLVESVGRQVRQLIFVLNKADRTTDAERSAASAFTRKVLRKQLARDVGPVLEVSAQERAENRGPERDWKELTETLNRLVAASRGQLVRAASQRGLRRLSEQLLAVASERCDALRRPIAESEKRIALMKESIVQAQHSMRGLSFLFMAEQQRLSDLFLDRRKRFVASALSLANEQIEQNLRSTPPGFGPSYRRRMMKAAQEIARRQVVPWLQSEQEAAEREYCNATLRFVEMANDFLRKVSAGDVPELTRMPRALDPEAGLRVRSKFTFLEFIELAEPASPLRWLADALLPLLGARRVIKNDGREFLVRLIETNCTRVQSDVLNRIHESRSRLEAEIRKLLHEVSRIAEDALVCARKVREEGEPAIAAEIQRLHSVMNVVSALANNAAASTRLE